MQNIYDQQTAQEYIDRIDNLTPETQPKWGKMNATQMLAHCNVAYDTIFQPENIKRPNPLMRLMMRYMVRPKIVSEKGYKPNLPTAPFFVIADDRNFEKEKTNLINNIKEVVKLGPNHFDGLVSFSFGKMNKQEWNNMLAKHLNHHFEQFGI